MSESRFWAKVEKTPTCWLWTAGRDRGGYGTFRLRGRTVGAHRAAWELTHGGLPPAGVDLDHLCRVRHCVNPSHLEPVPHAVNCQRGEVGQHAKGTANGRAKLTDEEVRKMRHRASGGATQRQLAKEFGVSKGTVYYVLHGTTWSNVA